jgi:D-serine deaminase-like pyridoxal phosphate-dependent protein
MIELAQRIAREYGTPAVVVDLDRVEHNIKRLRRAAMPPASPTGRTSRRTRAR